MLTSLTPLFMKAPLRTTPRFDSLARRPRDTPVSTGKQITVTQRDEIWFEKLHRHGHLPSSYLHAFTQKFRKSEKRAVERMGDLFHESNTKYKGTYLDRPWHQFGTLDARYQELVYSTNKHSEAYLDETNNLRENIPARSSSWKHDFLLSCVTASIELATQEQPSLYQYIHHDEVISRIGINPSFPVSFTYTDPRTNQISQHFGNLKPDRIIGIRYLKQGTTRLFLVEGDCNTEPNRSARFDRKSYRKSILQYREFVGHGLYKKPLQIEGGVLVMNITNNPTHKRNLIDLTNELAGERGNAYMLYKSIPNFEYYVKPPKPMFDLFFDPWTRAGKEPLDIT